MKVISIMSNRMCGAFTALVIATFSSVFSIAPLAANAQINNSNAPQKVSQARRQSLPNLKLSQQQIKKINQIRSNQKIQIKNFLTLEQIKRIQTDLKAGKNPRQIVASIRFTQQQKNQLRTIMLNSQTLMEGVLTPSQRKTLIEWRANRQNEGSTITGGRMSYEDKVRYNYILQGGPTLEFPSSW